jgi:hypothetical protein
MALKFYEIRVGLEQRKATERIMQVISLKLTQPGYLVLVYSYKYDIQYIHKLYNVIGYLWLETTLVFNFDNFSLLFALIIQRI